MFRGSKLALANTLNLLVGGLQKHLPTGALLVATTSYPTSQLVTSFTSLVTAIQVTATAKAAYLAAVKQEEALVVQLFPLVAGVRGALYVMYKGATDTLADFGIAPHKVPVLTPEQRAAAVAKAKATRLARHTMGKKQKAAITGATPAPATGTATTPAPTK